MNRKLTKVLMYDQFSTNTNMYATKIFIQKRKTVKTSGWKAIIKMEIYKKTDSDTNTAKL